MTTLTFHDEYAVIPEPIWDSLEIPCENIAGVIFGGVLVNANVRNVPISGGNSRKSLILRSRNQKMPKITGIYTGLIVPISSNLRRKR